MRRWWLSGACALCVLLACLSAAESSVIHKVARSFAFHKFPEVNLLNRAARATQNTLAPVELELSSSSSRAAESATEKLPTDARTPVENDAVTPGVMLDKMPSDALPSDSLPAPAAPAASAPVPIRGDGSAENEMRFRARSEERSQSHEQSHEQSQEQAQAQAESTVSEEERLETRRARSRSRVGFIEFGGMGKRFEQQKNKLLGRNIPHIAEVLEDCMGCRYIWYQVEMDVANARYVEDVQSSFEHNCLDAQKAPIFYNACEDMYDDMYAMTDDYMSQKYTVEDMCMRAKMCDDPSKKKFSIF